MVSHRTLTLIATSCLALSANAAFAQAARTPAAPAAGDTADTQIADSTTGDSDIVVTARRRDESLQNVPSTVTAISSNTLQKLNILRAEDIVNTVPGLTLSNNGSQQTATLRGVSIDSFAGAAPTVDLYLNETPTAASTFFTALYDVGQIEVLRGPQGTLRGRTAPSGAITLSTRRADLSSIGGYVNYTGTSRGGINGQGAIGLPIVTDRLAVRFAGVVDRDQANFVRSIFGGSKPDRVALSGRATVTAQPIDAVRANVTYQRVSEDRDSYTQVEGTGAPGGPGLPPAGYNGPVLKASDRASLQRTPSNFKSNIDILTGSLDIDVPGHRLSYVGGYQNARTDIRANIDRGNIFINADPFQTQTQRVSGTTQEIRFASNRPDNIIDYVVGGFYSRSKVNVSLSLPGSFLAGAYGSPAISPVVPGTLNTRYELDVGIGIRQRATEASLFGSIIGHLGPRTELTIGGRYIHSKSSSTTATSLGGAFVAVAVPVPCQFVGATSTYPGYCDFAVPPSNGPVSTFSSNRNDKTAVYSATLSHRFSDSLNVYANFGTSWRPGPTTIGISNATNNPILNSLIYLSPEKSRSYEIGAKTALFDKRLRVNVSVFHQIFDGFIVRLPETPYVSNNGAQTEITTFPFTANADAKVTGFDFDIAINPVKNLSISGAVSYAKGNLSNALIPCRDSNFDGIPDLGTVTVASLQARNTPVAFCRSKLSTSRDTPWSATGQIEYSRGVSNQVEGYLRGLVNYRPDNRNQDIGFVVPSYTLVNVYAGIRRSNGQWDVGIFAKNAFNNGTQLSRIYQPNDSIGGSFAYFGPTGYSETSYTRPREFGLNVRYSFGSR